MKNVQEVNRHAILLTQKSHPGKMMAGKRTTPESGFLFPEQVAFFTGIRKWTQVFPDPRLCKAVVDRLTFRAHIIETGSESMRLQTSMSRRKGN